MTIEITDSIIRTIRAAALTGFHDGRTDPLTLSYIRRCSHFHGHSGTLILFSRDHGHHSSGWMKNPDFERCWHLSLSFRTPFEQWPVERLSSPYALAQLGAVIGLAPFDWKLARQWVDAVLGADAKLAWTESPKSDVGKELNVMHWRVFVDEGWQATKPRGETYSKQLTRAGWRSWSDLNIEQPSHIDAD
jgi:hypothetical protein